MRAFVCVLSLLSLIACARSNVPLGTEDTGGDPSNASGNDDDAGNSGTDTDSGANNGAEIDSGANGMQVKDSGPVGMCPAATCTAATMLGEIDASNPDAVMMHQGMGSAFLRISAADTNFGGFTGPSATSGAIGVGVSLSATGGGKFEVYVRGEIDAAGEACVENGTDPGTDGMTTAIWNGEGPNPSLKPPRLLTIEVKQTEGACAPWTLTLTGMPCMILAPPLPPSCP